MRISSGMGYNLARSGIPSSERSLAFSKVCGAWAVLTGMVVIIGWCAHWMVLIQVMPGLPPMKYNTALGFIFSGTSLMLLAGQRMKASLYTSGAAVLLGLLTLMEYLSRRSFGIDELFIHDYIPASTAFAGRMSPLSANCFIFIGSALFLAGKSYQSRRALTAVGMLSCMVAMIACVALFGFAFGIETAYGWGAYTRMAVHTAVVFFGLGTGLAVWAWQAARRLNFNFLRWLPATGSLTLMVMITVTSIASFNQLKKASSWREHSYEVLNTAQVFLGDLFDIQRGMRSYVLTGLPSTLETYQAGRKNAPQAFAKLTALTVDNPKQERNLKVLGEHLDKVLSYSERLVDVRRTQGLWAAVQMESTGEGFILANRTLDDLHTFHDNEQRLFNERSTDAETDFRNTSRLLIFGSGLAAALLILANLMTSREMRLRRYAEGKLQEVASLQKVILDSANYAIISTNAAGIVTSFNSTAERWLGYGADEIVGKLTPARWHDADEIVARADMLSGELGRKIKPGFEVFTAKARNGKTDENEWTFVRKDGSRFPVWLSATALIDMEGNITGYLGVISDITARKKAEESLRISEERFRLIVDAVKDYALLMLDPQGYVVSWNTGAERINGYKASEIIGQHFSKFYSAEDIKRGHPDEELRIAAREGRYMEEGWRIRKDGERFLADIVITAIKDGKGELRGFAKVTCDITERKKVEETLRLSEERFSNAFAYAAIGMALVSIEGRWIKVNQSVCDFLGYSADELIGKTFQVITHPDDLDADLEHVRELLEGKIRSYTMEKRYFHKQGRVVWALLGVSLVRDERNEPLYFISQVEDITQMKEAMARQQELTQKAQAAERAKSEFLAIMSHEIRTPMNGVIGMTSILADTELTELQRDCVNTIHTSGESLLSVINDILDYSKIEAGRLQLESHSFNLRKCIEEAFDLFGAQIRLKHLEAAYLIAPDVPSNLMGDALRLRQILVNLIGNAIKFTPEGEITVNVKRQNLNEEECHLVFSVTDTGIGIPKEGLEKLFQAFQQVDTSTTRRYGGTGLGLIISKRLAEFMGGKMWVESKPGVGSTFFFSAILKASPETDSEDLSHDPALLKSRSVLVVDDNATNRHIMEIQLKIWGMIPTSVSTGREALEKLTRQEFDVALIDLQMPEMDGITLAQNIRKKTQIPLILLSSSGEVMVGEEANLFHCQIPKPIKHSHLLNALLKVTGAKDKPPQAVQQKQLDSDLAAKHPLRILLAEDNAVNQKVGLLILSRLGYTADLVSNGKLAVKAVENTAYDLILMDIQMPEMNGIEATGILRERLGAKGPVIFALTAEALEGDKERFLGLGFDGYLSKPLQADALQSMLKTVKAVV